MAIPATLGRLDAVGALVPDGWQSLYAQFGRTARAVQRSLGELPRGVVHGDAWPGNAVQSGPASQSYGLQVAQLNRSAALG